MVLQMQVDLLRQTCLGQMLFTLSSGNILSFASVADRLGEQALLDACLERWAKSPDRCCSDSSQSKLLHIIHSCHTLSQCMHPPQHMQSRSISLCPTVLPFFVMITCSYLHPSLHSPREFLCGTLCYALTLFSLCMHVVLTLSSLQRWPA